MRTGGKRLTLAITWEWLIPILLFCAAMTVRPTFLGDTFSYLGSLMVLTCGLITVSVFGLGGPAIPKLLISLGSSILLWLFLTVHAALNHATQYYALSALMQISACAIGGIFCFSRPLIHDRFFAIFRFFMALCAVLFLLTLAISLMTGIRALYLMPLASKNYETASALYFPFTQSYGVRWNFGIQIPRLGAWFRESGIAQAFFACAILSVPSLRTGRQWLLLLLLLIGGLAAQSTTGLAVVGVAFALRVLRIGDLNPLVRIFLTLAALIFGWLAIDFAINDQSIGFASKIQTNSFIDRQQQMLSGLQVFRENPFGYGVYSDKLASGINLIASLGEFGVFGILFILVNIIGAILGSDNRIEKSMFIAPLFFTALTSQPLLDAGLVYLFYGYLARPAKDRGQNAQSKQTRRQAISQIPMTTTPDMGIQS